MNRDPGTEAGSITELTVNPTTVNTHGGAAPVYPLARRRRLRDLRLQRAVPRFEGGVRLARPITGMVGSRTGHSYLTVAEDGGIFAFGAVPFHGSLGATLRPCQSSPSPPTEPGDQGTAAPPRSSPVAGSEPTRPVETGAVFLGGLRPGNPEGRLGISDWSGMLVE